MTEVKFRLQWYSDEQEEWIDVDTYSVEKKEYRRKNKIPKDTLENVCVDMEQICEDEFAPCEYVVQFTVECEDDSADMEITIPEEGSGWDNEDSDRHRADLIYQELKVTINSVEKRKV